MPCLQKGAERAEGEQSVSGEMAQQADCLLCKHGDLIFRFLVFTLKLGAHICNTNNRGGVERGGETGVCWPDSLVKMMSSRFGEKTCLQN